MKIKAVIFDLDGTLLDTIDDIADAMNYSLTKNGFMTHKVEDYKYFVGKGVDILVDKALEMFQYTTSQKLQVKNDYLVKYEIIQHNKTKPFDGIEELINMLRTHGIKLAVLSNKPHADTLRIIDYYFKLETFNIVLGQRKGVNVKPNPTGIFEIISDLHLSQKELIYVGDTNVDMQTAKAANVQSVGVTWGFRTAAELVENGADYIIDFPDEIMKIVSS